MGGLRHHKIALRIGQQIFGNMNPSEKASYDYGNTLSFWRAVELRYNERKKQWLNQTAKRMDESGEQRVERHEEAESVSKMTSESDLGMEEEYLDVLIDEEFSDVDNDYFIDPGNRYYSSLDKEQWGRIRQKIINIHSNASLEFTSTRQTFIRGILYVGFCALSLLIGGLILLWRGMSMPAPEAACGAHCHTITAFDVGPVTIAMEVAKAVFPQANANDEV